MDLLLDYHIADDYKSSSQKARVITEDWVTRNLYCPICGEPIINHYEANRPVADFFCDKCKSDFELKSRENKRGLLDDKIVDGAYDTMIERITSLRNPNFFFMTYANFHVSNFILIPNYFFTPHIIEKRNPLSENARRAGWIGCNINISNIPQSGKIFIVRNGEEINHQKVIETYKQTTSLKTDNLDSRGWLIDVLQCVDKMPGEEFKLSDIYSFENELKVKHPSNNFVKDKIRQQLQYLRDKGFIEFSSRGSYRKIH